MGQVESSEAFSSSSSSSSPHSSAVDNQTTKPDSLEALIAEATAFGDSEDESLDAKAQKALDCPCVAGLRNGPCGTSFSEAFLCYLKSTAEEKGSDCVHPFVALQNCIKVNPDAFSKDIVGDDESKKKEEETEEYKIIPPTWSKELKPKL
ncbi:hypothetical protein AQUCO_03500029v1 [Aquilegia coerulea]|uniref:Mitochondrial intermembrane space import and assembly protein 40 homolog n=1 Tax=Aquilegia coerulea TaxID=218851 RepID=A0A2G5CVQ6_AQUCA|nr:hypothetical protein AQUCO_03500029v1 [Aquilegia coerulea]